jgi:apolipoprotein N-acyltransferase
VTPYARYGDLIFAALVVAVLLLGLSRRLR